MKPPKPKKQLKLNFMPASPASQAPEPEDDFVVESFIEDTSTAGPSTSSSATTSSTTTSLTSSSSTTTSATMSSDSEEGGEVEEVMMEEEEAEEEHHTIPLPCLMCEGFVPDVPKFFENFAFQLLPTIPHVVLSGESLHHRTCSDGLFQLGTTSSGGVNGECASLEKDERLSCMIARAVKNHKELPAQTNNIFLTHTQLSDKCSDMRKQRNLLQLQVITKSKQLHRLNKVLGLHKRFMVLIAENNVLRVKELVSVALRNNRSISYIVDKVTLAINKVYRARPSEEDKDLSFIVLKLGGPTLLDVLCKANKLPSTSLAYRMGTDMRHLHSPVTMSVEECVRTNLDIETFSTSYSSSQKMDETFLTPRIRFDAKYNAFQGLCREHAPSDLQFNTIEDLEKIADGIRNDEFHAPKECLTVGWNRLDCKSKLNVVITWPTCSKKDYGGTWDLISSSSREYHKLTGKNQMNICSDADPTRKLVLHNYCSEELCELSSIHSILSEIPLLDLCCGPYEETVSYDPKHLVKRCWCSAINGTISINDVVINNEDLRNLLSLIETNSLTVDNLIKPNDKQNVPNATKFLLTFIKAVRDDDLVLPYRLQGIKAVLKLLSCVYEALLYFYVHPETSISAQIKAFSIGAHALFCLHRRHKSSIMSNHLVHDIQATLQDAIFCCAKAQTYFPEKPLFLVKNGTDPVESFFGTARAKNNNCNMDSLEFMHCATAISQVDNLILNKHPEWSKAKTASRRLCLDHSSVSDWKEENLMLKDVDICTRFKLGKLTVSSMLLELGLTDINFDDLSTKGSTFMKPFGLFIGVNDSEHDWSIPAEEDNDDDGDNDATADENNEDDESTDDSDINIGDFIAGKHDVTVEIDGKHVYKSTCVKEALSAHPISKDRLKKVRTFSTPLSSSNEAPSKLLYVGDPVVASKNSGNVIANIKTIRLANKKVKQIDMSVLESSNLKFDLMEITLEEKSEKYYWTGAYEGDVFSMTGKDIIPVQPDVDLEMKTVDCTPYGFNKQLVLDIGIHLQQQPRDTMVSGRSSKGTSKSASGGETSPLRHCLICNKKTTLESMRGHVAYHILTSDSSDLQDVCGFCGRQGSVCETSLDQSSHSRSEVYYKVDSSCDYQYDYKRVPNDTTKTHKCTNKVVRCLANNCQRSIWRYNAVHHYENNHPNVDIPPDFLVSEKERGIVLKTFKL